MGAAVLVPVEQYLKSVYRPDCDFVDGILKRRNAGELNHAWVQGQLAAFFQSRFRQTGFAAIPEWRFQMGTTRFRVPDLVLTLGKPGEQILTRAPLLCVEILPPEDTVSKINRRVHEYLDFGVPAV